MAGPGLLPIVRRWWWLLLAGALVGGLAGWLVASSATKTYEAETKLLVGPVSGDYPTLQAAGALGRTYAELAHSRRIVEAAARDTGLTLTRKQLEDAVTATSNDVTRIVEVRVRDQDPEAAAKLAGGVAGELMHLRTRAPAIDADPIDAIMRDPAIALLRRSDVARVRKAALHVLGRPTAGNLEFVEAPLAPRDPVSPRVGVLVLLAALAGLLLTAGFAFMREGMEGAGDSYDDFLVETFAPSANGAFEVEDEDEESWAPSGERE